MTRSNMIQSSMARSNSRMWRQFVQSPLALLGAVTLTLFFVMAAFAPLIAPYDPGDSQLLHRLESPTLSAGGESPFLLGTDHLGRDILSRLIYGSRIALIVGLGGVALSALVGISVGLIAGYFGGWYDTFKYLPAKHYSSTASMRRRAASKASRNCVSEL